MNTRVDQLRQVLVEKELDAILITDEMNRRWLSGFRGSNGTLYITADECILITDFRYFTQAAQQAPTWTLFKQTGWNYTAVGELLKEKKPHRLGFEADQVTVATFQLFRDNSPDDIKWMALSGTVKGLRAVKETEEADAMRRAQAITDAIGAELPQFIEPGQSEKAIAWAIEKQMRDLGADGLAFEVIVASGPNSALPHHRPSERIVQSNEPVTIDMGAMLNGYRSDMTRTLFTGEPTKKYAQVYNTVLAAQETVLAALHPGHNLKAADTLARDLITAAGYGDNFGHGLGHGVGMDIHEAPNMGQRTPDDAVAEIGNVITVEPGIYLPDWGGVRIEDVVLLVEGGVENLTHTTKDIDAWRRGRDLA